MQSTLSQWKLPVVIRYPTKLPGLACFPNGLLLHVPFGCQVTGERQTSSMKGDAAENRESRGAIALHHADALLWFPKLVGVKISRSVLEKESTVR